MLENLENNMSKNTFMLMQKFGEAIQKGDYHTILDLLKQKNMDINCWASRNNWTPLHLAIEENKPELVSLFLLMGANPNASCAEGSAIELACKKGNPTIVRYLLENPHLKGVEITEEVEGDESKTTIKYRISAGYVIESYTLQGDTISNRKLAVVDGNKFEEHNEVARQFRDAAAKGNFEKIESFFSKNQAFDERLEHFNRVFENVVESGFFDLVNRILQEGIYLSDSTLKKSLQSAPKPIKELIKLEKQKQIDLMQAYIENQNNVPSFQKAAEGIFEQHKRAFDNLLVQKEKNLEYLFQKIDALEDYGKKLIDSGSDKGTPVIELAKNIRSQIKNYLKEDSNKKDMSIELGKLISEGKKVMRKDRNALDKIAHIVLAFTVIGSLILLGNKYLTGSFFLNPTKREQLLDNINKDTKQIINIKRNTP
jgi:hypothetical protein